MSHGEHTSGRAKLGASQRKNLFRDLLEAFHSQKYGKHKEAKRGWHDPRQGVSSSGEQQGPSITFIISEGF